MLFMRIPLQLVVFIFFLGCLALFINSNNTRDFALWQLSIESIVERGNIHVDGSTTPGMHDNGDTFEYKGHKYSVRQPGQAFIGSVIYFLLYKLGITYKKDFVLAGGLVTLLTSVVMVSIIVVLFFNIVLKITKNSFWSVMITYFLGFGTLLFPYSGVSHHDVYATFFLFSGFYLLFIRYQTFARMPVGIILCAGLSIGFALFYSLNTLSVIIALWLYVLFHKSLKEIGIFSIALVIGILPSFIFNLIVFGHPFYFPTFLAKKLTTIGLYTLSDTHREILNILRKTHFYLFSPVSSITIFSPVFIVGFFGFFLMPREYLIEKVVLPLIFVFHLLKLTALESVLRLLFGAGSQPYLSVVETSGMCQYGPRYLLECIPFVLVGLSGFFAEGLDISNRFLILEGFLRKLVVISGVISVVVCFVGSMFGVMYCDYSNNAFLSCFKKVATGDFPHFNFVPFGIFCILLSFNLLLVSFLSMRHITK